jgi:hypothetical protein
MDHITPVLIRLHWLPVEYRSQYKLILHVFKPLPGLVPVYLTELVKPLRSITFSAFPVSITSPGTYHQNKDLW